MGSWAATAEVMLVVSIVVGRDSIDHLVVEMVCVVLRSRIECGLLIWVGEVVGERCDEDCRLVGGIRQRR